LVVWDLPLRIYHWLLMLCVILAFITSEWDDRSFHQFFGMSVLGLCCFRIIWGFIGSPSAKFVNFVKPPRIFFSYLIRMIKRDTGTMAGHSPVGGWASIVLIFITSWLALTGSLSNDDILFDGPFAHLLPSLSDLASELHENTKLILIGVVLMHLGALFFYRFWLGKNLVPAMIHGSRDDKTGPGGKISLLHTALGLGVLVCCLAAAYFAILIKPSFF